MTAIAVPQRELWLPGRDGIPHIEIPKLALPTPADVFGAIKEKLFRPETPEQRRAHQALILHMAGYSNAAEIEILDSSFGDHATINLWAAPVFLALTTAAVVETDTGSTLTEANYTTYARISVSAANMGAAAAGAKSNSAQLTGANVTSGSSVIIGWATVSASSAGTVILFGTCTSTTLSTTQTPPTINVGALSGTLD